MENVEDTITTLKRLARKTNDAKLRRHYDIVRLFLQGKSKPEIANIFDLSLQAIYNVLNRYDEQGVSGLAIGKSTGRKTKLSTDQERELYNVVCEKLPKDVGFEPFCNWTAALACKYVRRRFNVVFSERGMLNLLHRLGLSFTRPTYTLAKADPGKQEEFAKRWEGIKKTFRRGD